MDCGVCGTRLMPGAERCPICRTEVGKAGPTKIELPVKQEEKKKEELTLERVGLRPTARPASKGQKAMSLDDQLAELEREIGPVEGAEVEEEEPEPVYPVAVIEELMLLPGMTREKAKMAFDLGYGDLETMLLGAIRGQKDAASLAKILALRLKAGPVKKVSAMKVRCPSCRSISPLADLCAVCGFRLREAAALKDDDAVEKKIEESAGDVIQALTFRSFFDGLPETLKRVIGGHAEEILGNPKRESLLRTKLEEQIGVWKAKGYDAQSLEAMMAADFPALLSQGSAMLAEAAPATVEVAAPPPSSTSSPGTIRTTSAPQPPASSRDVEAQKPGRPAPPPLPAVKLQLAPTAKTPAKPKVEPQPADKTGGAVKEAAAAQTKSKLKPSSSTPKPGANRTAGWCSICGEEWDKGADECSACATALDEQRSCPKCKVPLHPSMKVCPWDGK